VSRAPNPVRSRANLVWTAGRSRAPRYTRHPSTTPPNAPRPNSGGVRRARIATTAPSIAPMGRSARSVLTGRTGRTVRSAPSVSDVSAAGAGAAAIVVTVVSVVSVVSAATAWNGRSVRRWRIVQRPTPPEATGSMARNAASVAMDAGGATASVVVAALTHRVVSKAERNGHRWCRPHLWPSRARWPAGSILRVTEASSVGR